MTQRNALCTYPLSFYLTRPHTPLCSSRGALLCHAGRTRRVRPWSSRLERTSLGTLNADLQGSPILAFYLRADNVPRSLS
jgi:hypothetical protein